MRLSGHDPDNNLSHQVLGVNTQTQEGFMLSPPKFVPPWKRNYPNGTYTIKYDTGGRPFDPKEWLFVAADNRCYNSPVLRHPFTDEGVVPARVEGEAGPAMAASEEPGASETGSLMERGRKTFTDNCAMCHYANKEETRVGPGLKGLFKRDLTPVRKVPVTEENIRVQIQKGGERMPPFGHISEDTLSALIVYLKSL